MAKIFALTTLFFFMVNIIQSCATKETNVKTETIKLQHLLKTCYLKRMAHQNYPKVHESFNFINSETEVLPFSFPESSIYNYKCIESVFILIPLFEIKGPGSKKISPDFFRDLKNFNRIKKKQANAENQYYNNFEFLSTINSDFVQSFKFNNVEVGYHKDKNIMPGYYIFRNPASGLSTIYLAVPVRDDAVAIGKNHSLYTFLNNAKMYSENLSEGEKNFDFELVLNLNYLKEGLLFEAVIDPCDPVRLSCLMKPTTSQTVDLSDSVLNIKLQFGEENGEPVYTIMRTFSDIRLKDMYLKLETIDSCHEWLVNSYLV
ncbi:hypothetical protein CDIK_1168 [Cucumispora dikerogammari]|nr:hypothetical protein CDIK_1168 [Cucumispora dikerogammari]